VGVALGQIGEFSFMLATVDRDLGLLPMEATHALVAAAIISIVLNPVAARTIRSIERWLRARPQCLAWVEREPIPEGKGAAPCGARPSRRGGGVRSDGTHGRAAAA